MYETMEPTSATINFSIVTSLLLNTFTAPSIVRPSKFSNISIPFLSEKYKKNHISHSFVNTFASTCCLFTYPYNKYEELYFSFVNSRPSLFIYISTRDICETRSNESIHLSITRATLSGPFVKSVEYEMGTKSFR